MPYGGGRRAPQSHQTLPRRITCTWPGSGSGAVNACRRQGVAECRHPRSDPVIVLEPKRLYRSPRGEVPADEWIVALGKARVVAPGHDVTLIAYGAMVGVAIEARAALAEDGMSAEVIDLRTLKPLDEDTVLDSVRKTGRAVVIQEAARTCGFGAEVAAMLAEKAIFDLRGPILRVTGYDIPYPPYSIENAFSRPRAGSSRRRAASRRWRSGISVRTAGPR